MKKMTEHQIVAILKEAEAGIPVKELCRNYSMGNSTFYKWRDKYSGMETSDIKRLKELEAENRKFKQMFAKLSLKSQLQEEIIKKALLPTKERKAWALALLESHPVTITMSCSIVGLSRCAYYYQPKLPDDSVIISVLSAITDKH
ncbi:transposase [Snodgrassella sp.]|uniref:transposase n=1 Tax=Snodgrassella sp. TaxID=2815304 RepID=UPI002586BE46|nr:transposase [Snodgrassella sp.]MCO6527044.1 transposase [Snodgrassella sp.]